MTEAVAERIEVLIELAATDGGVHLERFSRLDRETGRIRPVWVGANKDGGVIIGDHHRFEMTTLMAVADDKNLLTMEELGTGTKDPEVVALMAIALPVAADAGRIVQAPRVRGWDRKAAERDTQVRIHGMKTRARK